jgi:hypothetical protein
MITLIALLLSIALGTGSLAWGYRLVGLTDFVRWIILFGVIWLVAVWQRWRWFATVGLILGFTAAALGLWFLNFSPGWMLAGAIGGLLAWDLTSFRERLRFVASDEERLAMEGRHLVRIVVLALFGFLLASLAMAIKLQFNFQWAVLLAVVAILGVIQLLLWFRRRGS